MKDLKHDINCDNDAKGLVQLQDHYPEIANVSKLGNSTINGISHVGAKALAQALKSIDMITLDLSRSNNAIGDGGAVALAKALHHNSTLEKLHLFSNSISDDGAVALAQALCHNSTLKRLDLDNNSISDDGAQALAQALCHNSTLEYLWLHGNESIGKKGTHQLIESLAVNKSISSLSLPFKCREYAQQSPQYCSVQQKVHFC